MSPALILNPRSQCSDFVIPEALQKERKAGLEEGDKLQRGRQKTKEPKKGQTCWLYKLDEVPIEGILFRSIVEREGRDLLVKFSYGGVI